jgi:hypothetical protein
MSGTEIATRIAALLGLVLIAIGLVLGFVGISVPGSAASPGPSFACGHAFGGGANANAVASVDEYIDGPGVDDQQLAECSSKRHDRALLAGILVGLGAVSLIGVPLTLRPRDQSAPPPTAG